MIHNKTFLEEVIKFISSVTSNRSGNNLYTQRNIRILCDYISCDSLGQIADKTGLTKERVRQIVNKQLRILTHSTQRYTTLLENYDKLKEQNEITSMKYTLLQKTVKRYIGLYDSCSYMENAKTSLLKRKISEIGEFQLSVRTLNVLANNNIIYLWQLVSMSKRDCLSLHNMGVKSLTQLDDMLEVLNLGWEMPLDILSYVQNN